MNAIIQLGIAAGFCLTPFIVSNHDHLFDIKKDFATLFYAFAIFTTVLLAVIFFCNILKINQ